MKPKFEKKGNVFCPIREFKFNSGDGDEGVFEGHGAVFNNLDLNGDTILPGAFKKTLKESKKSGVWPAMLMQHGGWGIGADDMTPIGIWTDLSEDEKGLKSVGKLADTVRGQEAHTLMKMKPRPAISGLSIGFFIKEFIQGTKPEEPNRTIKSVDLLEISLVTFPANTEARVQSVKQSIAEGGLDIRYAENVLCDAGFSRSEARGILSLGFKKGMPQCDADVLQGVLHNLENNLKLLS